MNYEIIQLEETQIATFQPIRVTNNDLDLSQKMTALWTDFMTMSNVIPNTVTNYPICTYSNYESDEKGAYNAAIGLAIHTAPQTDNDLVSTTIPAGPYAKFVVTGEFPQAISACWQQIWSMDLPRKFTCDFEMYIADETEQQTAHIYIALK